MENGPIAENQRVGKSAYPLSRSHAGWQSDGYLGTSGIVSTWLRYGGRVAGSAEKTQGVCFDARNATLGWFDIVSPEQRPVTEIS